MTPEDQLKEQIKTRVERALASGATNFMEVLRQCDGADPRVVHPIWQAQSSIVTSQLTQQREIRAFSTEIPWLLPAPDPQFSQWWFTVDTVERLVVEIIRSITVSTQTPRLVVLGAPTVACRLARLGHDVLVYDIDPGITAAVNAVVGKPLAFQIDARQPIPDNLGEIADAVFFDPPWYLEDQRLFLAAASTFARQGAAILCTLPPVLTRPGAFEERNLIIEDAATVGLRVERLEPGYLRYLVPRFEERAYASLNDFVASPWRPGDLLQLRKTSPKRFSAVHQPQQTDLPQAYSRNAQEFRVFVRTGAEPGARLAPVRAAEAFSQTTSRRNLPTDPLDVWTSDKRGGWVKELAQARDIIGCWAGGGGRQAAEECLVKGYSVSREDAATVVRQYDQIFELWTRYGDDSPRRTAEELDQFRKRTLSQWATPATVREHGGAGDGFRLEFQRDRDRIVWSPSFRTLANKTQLFPMEHDDLVRQRLAHSIEVMQLAQTLGQPFGLDEDLIEAGALAHDIGHTPYGHAGEHAIDQLLKGLGVKCGFNHYEHGVDVVRFLEAPYSYARSGYMGLNLTPEVAECVFKHTFCQTGPGLSHDALRVVSKHREYLQDGFCHLEGQAVRLADKISYLVSDLEDGILLGALDDAAILQCRLFHRMPVDIMQPRGALLHERFLLQRRNVIRVIMEDAIRETSRRLGRIRRWDAVRSGTEYAIANSSDVQHDMDEIWRRLQAGRLHRDPRVLMANSRAARVVSELLLLVAVFPELVDPPFRASHERLWGGEYLRYYRTLAGGSVNIPAKFLHFLPLDRLIGIQRQSRGDGHVVNIEDLVVAKDFVASLTDRRAHELYATFLGK